MLAEALVRKLIKITVICLGGALADRLARRFFHRAFKKIPGKRANTFLSTSQNAASFILGTFLLAMILSELGINIAPLIASAGILGLAVGFGAQTLVKDLITGLFLLLDDTIRTGEIIKVAGIKGKVIKMGIRTLLIQDEEGTLHTIPNNSVSIVSNFSRKKIPEI